MDATHGCKVAVPCSVRWRRLQDPAGHERADAISLGDRHKQMGGILVAMIDGHLGGIISPEVPEAVQIQEISRFVILVRTLDAHTESRSCFEKNTGGNYFYLKFVDLPRDKRFPLVMRVIGLSRPDFSGSMRRCDPLSQPRVRTRSLPLLSISRKFTNQSTSVSVVDACRLRTMGPHTSVFSTMGGVTKVTEPRSCGESTNEEAISSGRSSCSESRSSLCR